MVDPDRRGAERRGRRAEDFAIFWLRLKGYRILEKRFRRRVGEIDVIAKRGNTIAFIEVKQRPSRALAIGAIPEKNWRRIAMAAEMWAAHYKDAKDLDWRFDLVAITPRSCPKHYRDFWRP